MLWNSVSIFKDGGLCFLNMAGRGASIWKSFFEAFFKPYPYPFMLRHLGQKLECEFVVSKIDGAIFFSRFRSKGLRKRLDFNVNYFYRRIWDLANFLVLGQVGVRLCKVCK